MTSRSPIREAQRGKVVEEGVDHPCQNPIVGKEVGRVAEYSEAVVGPMR